MFCFLDYMQMSNTWQTQKYVIASRWFCFLLNIDSRVRCVYFKYIHKEHKVFLFLSITIRFISNIRCQILTRNIRFSFFIQNNTVHFKYSQRTLGFSFFFIYYKTNIDHTRIFIILVEGLKAVAPQMCNLQYTVQRAKGASSMHSSNICFSNSV